MSADNSLLLQEEVLIFAPLGQDADLAASVLKKANMNSKILKTMKDLCTAIGESAAAILITEEAISAEGSIMLKNRLKEQETWSDIPIVLLTSNKKELFGFSIIDRLVVGGNVTILERPFRMITLVTAMRVAVRSRIRQFQVRDLLKEQARSVRQRDDFLSIASHELKTPITSLKLQVQMRKRFISKGDSSVYQPEKINAFINTTEHQLDRLSRLVDDMLDISRIENGKLALHYEKCNLAELVDQVLESFSANFHATGTQVTFKSEDDIIGNWDRYRIEQVIANLITNAIKYAPGKPVNILLKRERGSAVLSVKDNGIGIALDDQEKIFQRFERAVSAEKISGLGLGLYITKQILEMHNGKISVSSAIGKGSTFTVELPSLTFQENQLND